jgi:hypothetical protein
VKFRKPITEVMWATIPFLVTMIVALLVITYVPQLTVVPDAPRTGPLSELIRIAHEGTEESGSVKEVALILPDGSPVKDEHGKPIVKKLTECEGLASPSDVDKCKGLFLDVTNCRKKSDVTCEKAAVAAWAVENLEVITVTEVQLVAKDGTPVAGADGKPITKQLAACDAIKINSDRDTCREIFKSVSDCRNSPPEGKTAIDCEHGVIAAWITSNPDQSGVPVSVSEVPLVDSDGKPVKGKDGKQIVKRIAECDKADDKDACRELFVNASNCKIDWGDEATVLDCQKSKTGDWVSQNMSEP